MSRLGGRPTTRIDGAIGYEQRRRNSQGADSLHPSFLNLKVGNSTDPLEGDDQRSPCQLMVKLLIRNPVFENIMAAIIVLNFVMIIIEADSTVENESGEHSDVPVWIDVSGWAVLVLFIVELILRMYVDRMHFFSDGWNNFDLFIISIDTICSLLGVIFGNAFPVSALRILRLCKLTRMSKVFRVFPELRLMMSGLIGSIRSIFWGMILLVFVLLVWAVIGVQFIHPLVLKIAESGLFVRNGCERCPEAYASVARAFITLLQESVAGDAWGTLTVPLIEEYPIGSLYFIGVMMTVSMAVLNLILGVVVNVAMQSRDDMRDQMEMEKLVHRVELQTHLGEMCAEMDTDGSGAISRQELIAGYQHNEQFRGILKELDIEEDDLEILWTVLDPDKDGHVPYTTFIHKSYSMKQSDTQFMLAYIKYYVTKIRDQVLHGQEMLQSHILANRSALKNIKHECEEIEHHMEEKMQYDPTEKHVEESNIRLTSLKEDLGSSGPRKAANLAVREGSEVSPRFSEDDQKNLHDVLENSRRWQKEISTSINGVNARIDLILQDLGSVALSRKPLSGLSANLVVTPPQAPLRNKFWCFQRDTTQAGMESVVGGSRLSTEDVVELPCKPPAGLSWRSPRPA